MWVSARVALEHDKYHMASGWPALQVHARLVHATLRSVLRVHMHVCMI